MSTVIDTLVSVTIYIESSLAPAGNVSESLDDIPFNLNPFRPPDPLPVPPLIQLLILV